MLLEGRRCEWGHRWSTSWSLHPRTHTAQWQNRETAQGHGHAWHKRDVVIITSFDLVQHILPSRSWGVNRAGLASLAVGRSAAQELRHFVWLSDPSPVLLYQLLKGKDKPYHVPYLLGWQLSRVAVCFCPRQAAFLLPFLQSFLGPSQAAVPSCPGSSSCSFVSGMGLRLGR